MTQDEIREAIASANAIFKALPKTKQEEYLGELNIVMLVLERMQRMAARIATEGDPDFVDM